MSDFQSRIIRAAKLDKDLYEEVEADGEALGQAMGVVVLSSIAAGLSTYGAGGFSGLIMGTFGALLSWFIWAYITYFVGTRLLPVEQTHATHGQLLRTIGFSSAPGILRIIGVVPGLSWIIGLITGIWMLVAMVIAVRQALDYNSTGRALGVCFIGWIIQAIILGLIYALFL